MASFRWTWAVALAFAAACGPPVYVEPPPKEPLFLQPPPEVVLRVPTDFAFRDYPTGRQFLLRRYTLPEGRTPGQRDLIGGSVTVVQEANSWSFEVVTVFEAGAGERLATAEEREYAFSVLQREWLSPGREKELSWHRTALARERERHVRLLDQRLYLAEKALEDLEDERFRIDADFVSSRDTEGYTRDEKHGPSLEFLQKELVRLDVLIASEKAEVHMLRYDRYLRDSKVRRSTQP